MTRVSVPGHWRPVSLREVLTFQVGFPFRSEYFNAHGKGLRLIRNRDLRSSDSVVYYDGPFDPAYIVRDGDLLVGMDGDFEPTIWRGPPSLLNQRVGRIVCLPDAYPGFLAEALIKPLEELEAGTGATTVKHLSHGDVERLVLPLPTVTEQKAVAEVLGSVRSLIGKLDQTITKKRDIQTGLAQQLLAGRTRLPGFTDSWQSTSLGQVMTIRHGRSQHEVVDPRGTYPILATGGQIGWATVPLYTKPSVLIGRKGTIDRPQFMDTPFWTVDTLFYSEIDECRADPRFLYYIFNTIDWRSMNEASGVPSLSASRIEGVHIDLPSLPEQEAIRDVLDAADTEIAALETRLAKAKLIREGMMQELLTGRTRLPGFGEVAA